MCKSIGAVQKKVVGGAKNGGRGLEKTLPIHSAKSENKSQL
jgi:hypothetical protein